MWRMADTGCYADLAGNDPVVTGVLHEDLEDLGDDLGEVDLELCPQGSHYLLHQVNDGVLHGTVGAPVFLGRHRSKVIIQLKSTKLDTFINRNRNKKSAKCMIKYN